MQKKISKSCDRVFPDQMGLRLDARHAPSGMFLAVTVSIFSRYLMEKWASLILIAKLIGARNEGHSRGRLRSELHNLRGAFRVLKDGEGRRAESALRRFEYRLNNIISSIGSSRSCRAGRRRMKEAMTPPYACWGLR